MAIEIWDPFRDLLSIQDRMNRLFDETLSRAKDVDEEMPCSVWSPRVDIYDTKENIILNAELPGIDIRDIKIEVNDGTLLLSGKRKFGKDVKKENYHMMERSYGTFKRSFSLHSLIDQEGVKAKYNNGILEIILPKVKKSTPKKVSVKIQ